MIRKPLTILSVAYPLAPVGPDAVGGAEQVLSALDHALVRAGHNSIVVAAEGSAVAGELVATPHYTGELTETVRHRAWERHRCAIRNVLAHRSVDLIHLHGLDFDRYLPPAGPPVLATLHLPPAWYAPEVFHLDRPRTRLVCVSRSQRAACPPDSGPISIVPNGVDTRVGARHARRRFALALGRICPEKGFHLALDAAARAGVGLILAGEVFRYPAHERYFREEIVPRLGGGRRFIGPVGLARKRRLLSAARCLLVPSLAPETSSLVAMEALACGTPVVGFAAGALPEIIEHGKTGYIVDGVEEMAEAIEAAGGLRSEDCRRAARMRFSQERMVREYIALYRELIKGGVED